MKVSITIFFLVISTLSINSCKQKGCTDSTALNYDYKASLDDGSCVYPSPVAPIDSNSEVLGYGILNKLVGIWNGPVSSPTPIGSFSEWIVDFRPISGAQISAKNELDSLNDIFMSFFICKYDNSYKVALRNGGGFAGAVRNSYMLVDSVYESPSLSFYRFIDPVSGGTRVYTDVTVTPDSLKMHVFTNKFNTLSNPVTHMIWTSKLMDKTSAQDAVQLFDFPKKEITKDFTLTFNGDKEAVYYSTNEDPYPEHEQPYLGKTHVQVTINNPVTPNPAHKVLIVVTTEPLFNGFVFKPENLKYRSRYVFVGAKKSTGIIFNYMHPGNYYVNAVYDSNDDLIFNSGDFINSSFDVPFNLKNKGNTQVDVKIDFEIP